MINLLNYINYQGLCNMSRYISFCSRCAMPNGTGQDLCTKCKKIMIARKVSISRRENKENKQSK